MNNFFLKISFLFILLSAPLYSIERDASCYDNAVLLSEIFIKRHSGIHYDPLPLNKDQIQALIQAARWSPSSYNDQPWNFIFCDRFKTPEAYLKVIDSIYGQEWVENATLLVIVIVRPNFLYNNQYNDWAEYDAGAAAICMSLQATDLGLMSHQIGGFDQEQIKQDFHLPEGYYPLTIISIGYEKDIETETDRSRRPKDENFFLGEWGQSFDSFIDPY